MKCSIPNSKILRFIDSEMNEADRQVFLMHMEQCPSCQKRVNNGKALISELGKEASSQDAHVPAAEIMRKIRTNSSKKAAGWNLQTAFRRLALPLSAVLILTLVLAIPESRQFLGKAAVAIFNKQGRLPSTGSPEIGNLSLNEKFQQTSGDALVKELNEKGMGVSSWEVLFASKDRILIRNFASLLVYSNGTLKKAADLQSLGLDHIQGSVVTTLQVSPDGRFVLAGNQVREGDNTEESVGTYLFEVDSGRYTKLSSKDPDALACAWSFNGKWLAASEKRGSDRLRLINLDNLDESTLTIASSHIEALYVSNSGKIAYYTGDEIKLQGSDTVVPWQSTSQEDAPFYIDADSKTIWFVSDGNLSKQEMGSDVISSRELDRNGGSTMISWRVIGHYLVYLLEGGDIGYVNLQSGFERTFGLALKIDTTYLPWCRVSDNGSILIDRDGRAQILGDVTEKLYESQALSTMPLYMSWIDDEKLVFIGLIDDRNPQAGEFSIKELSYTTGETSEIYRTTTSSDSNTEPPSPSDEPKAFFNRASTWQGAWIYSEPDGTSALVKELTDRLSDPNQSHELNIYDEVVNNFVRVESDDGIQGWALLKDLTYGDNYKNFSYEKNYYDFNGDRNKDQIELVFSGGGRSSYTLTVNGSSINGDGDEVAPYFKVVDINPGDSFKEIVIEEFGPSSDYKSAFYYYDGSSLRFMGKVQGLCGNYDSVRENGTVVAQTRGSILETWFYNDIYNLDSNHMLSRVAQDFYKKNTYSEYSWVTVKVPEVRLYESPGSSNVSLVLKNGDKVRFAGSDDKEWCYFVTPDDKLGWIRVTNFNEIPELNMNANDVFEGLCNAD